MSTDYLILKRYGMIEGTLRLWNVMYGSEHDIEPDSFEGIVSHILRDRLPRRPSDVFMRDFDFKTEALYDVLRMIQSVRISKTSYNEYIKELRESEDDNTSASGDSQPGSYYHAGHSFISYNANGQVNRSAPPFIPISGQDIDEIYEV